MKFIDQKISSYLKAAYTLTGLLLVSFTNAFSQETNLPKYKFKSLKNSHTQRAVSSISQDHQGFIWMGTYGLGINKYNGIDFISYQFNELDSTSVSNSLIHETFVDSNNRVWIGTEVGLDIYNREQDNFTHIQLLNKNLPKINISVQTIIEDTDGTILVGTHQQGLFKIDPNTLKVERINVLGVKYLSNLLINKLVYFENRILAGSNLGLLELETESKKKLQPLSLKTFNGETAVTVSIETMEVDSKGTLWIGTSANGLIKIDGNEKGRYSVDKLNFTSKRVLSILETPRNTILCGSENEGMFEIDKNGEILNHYINEKFEEGAIKSNSIWDLFLDKQHRIWISYYNKGIGVFDKNHDKFSDLESKINYANSLQSSSVTGICEDDQQRLWLGIDGGGIDVFSIEEQKFTHLLNTDNPIAKGLNASDVQTLFKDSKGNMWAGTWNSGIYLLPKGQQKFINYNIKTTNGELNSNRILSFSEDSNGTIWIGTFSNGIYSFDPTNSTFTSYTSTIFKIYELSYSDVRCIYVDSEDNIWIGSNAGLFKLIKKNNKFEIESLTHRLHNNADRKPHYTGLVLQIFEDSAKNIWLGTDGNGLFKYSMKKDNFSRINPDGFNKVTVSSIIEDDDNSIWVAGNNGISKFNINDSTVTNFSVNDGLLTNDFNINSVFKNDHGTLFFGSYEGVNYFNPNSLPFNSNVSSVYLSDLKLFNKSVGPGQQNSPLNKVLSQTKEITLNHNQSVFTIDYAPIDFTRPEKINFAYYLDGFESDWNFVQNTRSATYTNLPAGEYTFKVKAANSDGIWNENSVDLQIEILRPWWLTNLVIFCYLILFLVAGYYLFQYLNSRLKNKRLILQEREKFVQEELLNNKKIQFFTNISHEFRTPLTLILGPLEYLMNEANLPENIKKKHTIIQKNAVRLKRLIDELMDFRKLQYNEIPLKNTYFNLSQLLENIISHFTEEAEHRNIMLSLEKTDDELMLLADRSKIEKIIFNLLSNAFKSTPTNGIITLMFSFKKEHFFNLHNEKFTSDAVEISIEDTGKGIEPEELNNIFDRFYQVKELNEQYYGGTGIGLELVRSFVNLHRGEISVESEIGVGTKFKVVIPLNNNQIDIQNSETTKILEANKLPIIKSSILNHNEVINDTREQKKSILIVEDNFELSSYIKDELKENYKVIIAENGKKGLQLAFKNVPDLIISDVIMPVMNGIDFCKEVKNDLKTSHIPVLMLTAKASSDDWVEGLDSGADVYMNKPFEMKIMKSHIKQLINNRSILYSKYLGESKFEISESKTTSIDQQFILNIVAYVNKNINEPDLNVEKLASEFFLSRSQLYRKIKALTGVKANELIRNIRLDRAKELIENTEYSISEICDFVGFSSPSYFSKCFKKYFGIPPTDLKKD